MFQIMEPKKRVYVVSFFVGGLYIFQWHCSCQAPLNVMPDHDGLFFRRSPVKILFFFFFFGFVNEQVKVVRNECGQTGVLVLPPA
jgi:hypothetical protein